MRELLLSLGPPESSSGSFKGSEPQLLAMMDIFQQEQYMLWYDCRRHQALIVLKEGAGPTSQLKAWSHALLVAREGNDAKNNYDDVDENDVAINRHRQAPMADGTRNTRNTSLSERALHLIRKTLLDHSTRFDEYIQRLNGAGWDVDTAALETKAGFRIAPLDH